jgi:hypothetical protein
MKGGFARTREFGADIVALGTSVVDIEEVPRHGSLRIGPEEPRELVNAGRPRKSAITGRKSHAVRR